MSERPIRRHQREHWSHELYDALDDLLTEDQDLTAPALIREVEARYPDVKPPQGMPDERTIREWRRSNRIGPRADMWSLAASEPGEAQFVLPVLLALSEASARRRTVTIHEARVIARVGAVAPGLPPLGAHRFAGDCVVSVAIQPHLDLFIAKWAAVRPWDAPDGPARLEDAVATGWLEPPARYVGDLPATSALGAAIRRGIQRQFPETRRETLAKWALAGFAEALP